MSTPPLQEMPQLGASSGSVHTLASRPLQPIPDPSISKRVCFYKSGDTQFSGHRMVINARTFKTFDALLDALSKKVPLPFGVRTITTPRGTHPVKGLEDLHDGGSYVCSDTKRIKPLNMEAVGRRQVPWNTTRPVSTRRRARRGLRTPSLGRQSEAGGVSRPSRAAGNRVAVRTPKRLVVFKNKDPNIKRMVVLQRKTAPTFEALLDYLSQVMQFPVLKLYSADGRRVDGLATLILCSGVIVAAGNEPFRPRHTNVPKVAQGAPLDHPDPLEPSKLHALSQTKKSYSSGRGSRNFSLSSERYVVNQIKQSLSGSSTSHPPHRDGSAETELNHYLQSADTETGRGRARAGDRVSESIVPKDDDIEKSFRVNQDGSMTVEMKVRLTIKEDEMLHWTTTLSRSSLTQSTHTEWASKSGSGNNSPDSNNAKLSAVMEDESKEENHLGDAGRAVDFREERECNGVSPTAAPHPKAGCKRKPTPGPRHVKKKTSVESIKTLSESGVEETTLGRFSYLEKTVDGEVTEEYCEVRQSSSRSRSRPAPVPLPRKTGSAGAVRNGTSVGSPGRAEVLQIQSNGMEITETVMHIYETQGCYDNYVGNALPEHAQRSKAPSTESGPRSSDCDVDFSRMSTTTSSPNGRQQSEILSLSSEPPKAEIRNNLSSFTDNEAHAAADSQAESSPKETGSAKTDSTTKGDKRKTAVQAKVKPKSSTSTTSSDKKLKESWKGSLKSSKQMSSPEKHSSSGKKSGSGTDSEKRRAERAQTKKKVSGDELTPSKKKALALNIENIKGVLPKKQSNLNGKAARENGHNVNTPETEAARPLKKNMLDILPPKQLTVQNKKILITKQKSMNEKRTTTPKQKLELSESVSMPALNDVPSDVHQYVENWLQKISTDSDPPPYMEEVVTVEPEPEPDPEPDPGPEPDLDPEPEPKTKVVFQLGDDSESEVKGESSPSHTEEHEEENKSMLCEGDAGKSRSFSCLSVPVSHEGLPLESGTLRARGLCSSMPSVRIDPAEQESGLRMDKSVEAMGPVESSEVSYTSNLLSPKARIKPVIQQLCSSIQGIRRLSEPDKPSGIEKSRSLPDFSSHVSSVFGSPSRAFMSFLSSVTLRDSYAGSEAGDSYEGESRDPLEALLVIESLQKISAIEDKEEQRASLTDLQGRTSSQLRERWRDFQARRERLESEPASPKFSETEFALDVVSEAGDGQDDQRAVIEELMEELKLPPELREGLTSLVDGQSKLPPQCKSMLYPEVEESSIFERHLTDSEEELEVFARELSKARDQLLAPESTCLAESVDEAEHEPESCIVTLNNDSEGLSQEGTAEKREREANFTHEEVDILRKENDKYDDKEEVEVNEGENTSEKEFEEREMREEVKEEENREIVVKEEDYEEKVEIKWDKVEEMENEDRVEDEDRVEVNVSEREEALERQEDEEDSEEEEGEKVGKGEEGKKDDEEEEGEEVAEGEEIKEVDEEDQVEEGEEIVWGEEEKEVDEEEEVEGGEEIVWGEEEKEGEEAEEVVKEVEEGEEVAEEEIKEVDEEEVEEGEKLAKVKEDEEGEEEEREEEEREEDNAEQNEADEGDVGWMERDDNIEQQEEDESVEEKDNVGRKMVGEAAEKDQNEEVEEENDEREEEEVAEGGEEDEEEGAAERDEEVFDDRTEEVEEEEVVEEKRGTGKEERWKTENEQSQEEEDEEAEEWKGRWPYRTGKNKGEKEGEEDKEEGEGVEVSEEFERVDNRQVEEEGEDRYFSETYSANSSVKAGTHKRTLEEASYMEEPVSCEDETPSEIGDVDSKGTASDINSVSNKSPADNRDDGYEARERDLPTAEGEEEKQGETERNGTLEAVEISQGLLDFVNSALQSSSLTLTYDSRGNIRIEPDKARVLPTKEIVIPKLREDCPYRKKRLATPNTSELSDYRPESSESGGYNTQGSMELSSLSGEGGFEGNTPDYEKPGRSVGRERASSKLSPESPPEGFESARLRNGGSLGSYDSAAKASAEDLSYVSGEGGSLQTNAKPGAKRSSFPVDGDPKDGVLIDQGRWLLKENHLIRKSPPEPMGMYGNIDSSSVDTAPDNTSQGSPPRHGMAATHSRHPAHNVLAAISSSELEELAKPPTPKCSYYNLPHTSDSDPFLDDVSIKSGKKDAKRKDVRVSPTIDTSRTWSKKNGSTPSFASVEFKLPDSRVHPEEGSGVVVQAHSSSVAQRAAMQAQDSLESLQVRCGQYCPIL